MSSLAEKVHIARRFQRSVRIDADISSSDALDGFVCPRSSSDVLVAMANHLQENGHAAFTWTGPYGSGKSSLALIVAALLSGDDEFLQKARLAVGNSIADAIQSAFRSDGRSWTVIPAVGRRASLCLVIGEAFERSGICASPDGGWTDDAVLKAIWTWQQKRNASHMFIFVDEMGKVLENSASGEGDLYLFQQIAEISSRSKGSLAFVGILHQAFGEYANRMSREARDEWSKVQGRFVDLIINAAGEEQIELLSRAIRSEYKDKRYGELARIVAKQIAGNRPQVSVHIADALAECWPLHPVVAALLGPVSRRRFGQNQRSLFGFLNSAEPHGFQAFLREATDKELYTPNLLWNYLQQNLEPAILASPDGHRWAVAAEAVARCEVLGGEVAHINLLKAIAVIDLFRERSGLVANAELLAACYPALPQESLDETLRQLADWSLVLFKKYLGGFAIFAGSDFDLDEALDEATRAIDAVDFSKLNSLAGLQPILAKRHYHKTGALRWFDIEIAPLSELSEKAANYQQGSDTVGLFLLAFPTDCQSETAAESIARDASAGRKDLDILVGLSPRANLIQNLAKELLALEHVRETRSELLGDAVARREVTARITNLQSQLEAELQRSFDGAKWFHGRSKPKSYVQSELSGLASDLADKRYAESPCLKNELLNRLKPSSNAVAAQNALLRKMVTAEGQARLGIEGYPAEGGLFSSLLEATLLYQKSADKRWTFAEPTSENDPANLAPLWAVSDQFLTENESRSVSLAEIYSIWRAEPFGVKDGLLPLLAVAYVLTRRNVVALYRQNIFQAQFTDLDVDYLVKDAGDIQVRWMDLNDVGKKLLSSLAGIVRELDPSNTLANLEPIDVGRGLIGLYLSLPIWTQRTMRLSANAIRIRDLFKKANDPNQFIFNDLPKLFARSEKAGAFEQELIEEHLHDGLQEMLQAYPSMLSRLADNLLAELQVPNSSPQSLADLRERAENIRDVSGDFRLNAFINRLASFQGSRADIEGLASLATNKPPRDWIDSDLDRAAIELTGFAQSFNKTETVARIKGRADKRHAMAVMVGLGGRPTPLISEFDVTDRELAQAEAIADKLAALLEHNPRLRPEVRMAAIACLSARMHDGEGARDCQSEAGAISNG